MRRNPRPQQSDMLKSNDQEQSKPMRIKKSPTERAYLTRELLKKIDDRYIRQLIRLRKSGYDITTAVKLYDADRSDNFKRLNESTTTAKIDELFPALIVNTIE